jgi:SSS family transporter
MNLFDYLIVAAFFGGLVWMGARFKRHRASADYFLGGKTFGWFPLCLSSMAAQLSIVSFISAPAFVGLRRGGGMQWLTFEFAVPLAVIVLIGMIAPVLYRANIVSVYAYVERRFSPASRTLLASIFLVSRSFGAAVVIYALCLMLSSVIGSPFWPTMVVISAVAILYAVKGGMKAIVYSDAAMMIIKFCGILAILGTGLYFVGGWSGFAAHLDHSRLRVVDFHNTGFNGQEYGFWPMVVGGLFLYCSYYGADQLQAQRLLSARDEVTVRKYLFFNGMFRFPVTLSYCFGGLVIGALVASDPAFAAKIPAGKPDLMIPFYIVTYLPHGVVGLLVVAMIAAAMSQFSSSLNSLSAVAMEDVVGRWWKVPAEKYVFWSKVLVLGWGLYAMVLTFWVGRVAATVIEALNKFNSLFYGPIIGMFLLGITNRRVTARAANVGLVAGVIVNVTLWIDYKNVFWFWWNAIGGSTTLALGLLLSLIPSRASRPDGEPEVVSTNFLTKETAILIGYFIAVVGFCIALPSLFPAGKS